MNRLLFRVSVGNPSIEHRNGFCLTRFVGYASGYENVYCVYGCMLARNMRKTRKESTFEQKKKYPLHDSLSTG